MEAKSWDVIPIGMMSYPKIPNNVATIAGVAIQMLTNNAWTKSLQNLFAP